MIFVRPSCRSATDNPACQILAASTLTSTQLFAASGAVPATMALFAELTAVSVRTVESGYGWTPGSIEWKSERVRSIVACAVPRLQRRNVADAAPSLSTLSSGFDAMHSVQSGGLCSGQNAQDRGVDAGALTAAAAVAGGLPLEHPVRQRRSVNPTERTARCAPAMPSFLLSRARFNRSQRILPCSGAEQALNHAKTAAVLEELERHPSATALREPADGLLHVPHMSTPLGILQHRFAAAEPELEVARRIQAMLDHQLDHRDLGIAAEAIAAEDVPPDDTIEKFGIDDVVL